MLKIRSQWIYTEFNLKSGIEALWTQGKDPGLGWVCNCNCVRVLYINKPHLLFKKENKGDMSSVQLRTLWFEDFPQFIIIYIHIGLMAGHFLFLQLEGTEYI
jgi:hypothetical protein